MSDIEPFSDLGSERDWPNLLEPPTSPGKKRQQQIGRQLSSGGSADEVEPAHKVVAYEEADDKVTPVPTPAPTPAPTLTKKKGAKHTKAPNGEKRKVAAPITTAQYVEQAKKKAELLRLKRHEKDLEAEQQIREAANLAYDTRAKRLSRQAATPTALEVDPNVDRSVDDLTAGELVDQVRAATNLVSKVAAKSGHLCFSYVKNLKDAAAFVEEAVDMLRTRTISDETLVLQSKNERLQQRVADLEKKLAEAECRGAEAEKRQRHTPPTEVELPVANMDGRILAPPTDLEAVARIVTEQVTQNLMQQFGGMLSARFERIEDRLLPEQPLRPPLAPDAKKGAIAAKAAAAPMQTKSAKKGADEAVPSTSAAQSATQLGGKVKGRKKPSMAGREAAQTRATVASQPQTQTTRLTTKKTWATIASKEPKDPRKAQAKPSKKGPVKLNGPKAPAVMLTLDPSAMEGSGLTYGEVLADAKAKIEWEPLGIKRLRFKEAMTGARMLELPGTTPEKADELANKLREILPAAVKVTRPSKSVALRISGLDDSVTTAEVTKSLAKIGGCTTDDIRAGEIKWSRYGGTIFVRCPVKAAQKVVENKRLLVGWVSASVRVLEQRPLHCYRCLERGHVGCLCKSDIDRSGLCFRCSKPGHKAATCQDKPHCTLCAAAGRSSDHSVGAPSCKDRTKGRRQQQLTSKRTSKPSNQ